MKNVIPLLKFADNIEDGLLARTQHNFDKPRMRICFDPEHEIPKLQAWFAENNHPSRLQVEEYVATLNGLESRKGKKPLDINNVIYWFKNTRAAVKRQMMKDRSGAGVHHPAAAAAAAAASFMDASKSFSPGGSKSLHLPHTASNPSQHE